MCFRRIRSSGSISSLSAADDVVAEIPAEVPSGAKVDRLATHERRKFFFELGHAQQSGNAVGLELDEEVQVAVGPRGALDRRAEDGQLPDDYWVKFDYMEVAIKRFKEYIKNKEVR